MALVLVAYLLAGILLGLSISAGYWAGYQAHSQGRARWDWVALAIGLSWVGQFCLWLLTTP